MEQWIVQGRFLEFGEYKGNIYGTLIDSVVDVIKKGSFFFFFDFTAFFVWLEFPYSVILMTHFYFLIGSGKTPVLNPHPLALRILRSQEFKAFVIFIRPPCLEKLKVYCVYNFIKVLLEHVLH